MSASLVPMSRVFNILVIFFSMCPCVRVIMKMSVKGKHCESLIRYGKPEMSEFYKAFKGKILLNLKVRLSHSSRNRMEYPNFTIHVFSQTIWQTEYSDVMHMNTVFEQYMFHKFSYKLSRTCRATNFMVIQCGKR